MWRLALKLVLTPTFTVRLKLLKLLNLKRALSQRTTLKQASQIRLMHTQQPRLNRNLRPLKGSLSWMCRTRAH